jgi:GxxExxY protein
MAEQNQDEMTENEIGKIIVDCAVRLHMELGPGLLETAYEVLLTHLLQEAGLKVERQVPIPIQFRGIQFDEGFRADIIVEDKVILELKSVESISKAHKKQVLTYLKLTDKKLGYLLNFGEGMMKDGISRILNGQIKQF